MISSCGRLLAIALTGALSATAALAQIGAPIQIGPPTTIAPPTTPPAESPPADTQAPGVAPPSLPGLTPQAPLQPRSSAEPPRTTSDGSIRIDAIGRLTIDAVGTLSPAIGGMRPDHWTGTPGDIAIRLVGLMPPAPDSRALRDVARRLLLSAGPAPADIREEGTLLAARADRLLAMGAIDELAALEGRVPATRWPLGLTQVFTEAALARGDDVRACALFDRVTNAATDGFWIKVAMVCDLRAGRNAKVDFGARLLREIGADDPLMIALAQAATAGASGGAAFRMGGASPVQLALARIAGLPIDPDIDAISSLPVLVALARGSGAPPFASRLAAAEAAERAGAATAEAVTALYGEVSVAVDTVDAAIAAAEADPGPLGRAILWRVAESQTVPIARAQAIAKAMELAETDAVWRQTVRLFAPFLVTLAPGPDLDWFAVDAVRGLIAVGDVRAARGWIDRMRRLAASGNRDMADAWLRLWALARIAGGDEVTPFDEGAVARWWDNLRTVDPALAPRRAAAALALMAALGDPVGADAWRGLASLPSVEVQAVPGTAYAFAIRSAVDSQRLAESVALATAALGEASLGEVAIPALADIARTLRAVDLEAEARRFAAEAALAHGL